MRSSTPPEHRGMTSTARCQQGQLKMLFCPGSLSPPFLCPPPSKDEPYVPPCWVSPVPPSSLFDLACCELEALVSALSTSLPAWSESVRRMPGCWGQARVGRSVRKPPPSPPLPPASFLHPAETERRKAGGSFTSHFTRAPGGRGVGGGGLHVTLSSNTPTGGKSCLPCYHYTAWLQGGPRNYSLKTNVSAPPQRSPD